MQIKVVKNKVFYCENAKKSSLTFFTKNKIYHLPISFFLLKTSFLKFRLNLKNVFYLIQKNNIFLPKNFAKMPKIY